jgi:tRNA pseudouridine13 synthase
MIDSTLVFDLPTITPELPGIGGVLRLTPDHFVVEELPLYLPQDEGQHLYVSLTKEGLTTKEVQAQLEQLFGLRRGEVGFAGLKDKAARTTQTFSVAVGFQKASFASEAEQRIRDQLPVEVHWARFHRNKLRPGHLLGNRFTITVSQLACEAAEAGRRAQLIATALAQRGAPNYFGPQRFGSGGDGPRQGLEILLGVRIKHDRWLRRFLIASYQSYLCNRYLARRVEMGAFHLLLSGDIAKKYATGGMFEVEDVTVEQPRYAGHEISFTAPLFGSKMWAAKEEAGALEASIMAEAPVSIEHFARARVEGSRRLGRLLVKDLQVTLRAESDELPDELPDELTVCFELPKGAFATTVLRELMKVDLAQAAQVDQDDDEPVV